ncbi:5'/3'-nucleotidase SurE [Geotoga petraea]|jgi:5'-nucleotidase|uniref:5'-nucleotidase SurE n=1 Tax=Geotoga petraea TaxID=28234 RepID=A0A1G6LKH1_9BACT|nr:5'/3'-nucleotidase SurE [Geotoga petraea]TGG87616.1 5'/3'-nucleotidase SurE [Geotoga petraea]SDC43798.1 5'-nucleotidase /3'-nucleotidase /exopolyphosphatase [Geotoga petraea]
MKILISNDDGIMAPGISVLKNYLEKDHEVYIVAPDVERSATGHAITIRNPLWAKKVEINQEFFGYAVNGTPADCIKLGALAIYKDIDFDLVISGINRGANMGTDILYSGTVSAALEGAITGYPSIAVSSAEFNDPMFETAGQVIIDLLNKIDVKKIPEFTTLNVNVPNIPIDEIKGFKVTRQSTRRYEDYFDERTDPYGNSYYWMLGKIVEDDDTENSDYHYVNKNYVSITPLSVFLTNKEYLDKLIRVIEE